MRRRRTVRIRTAPVRHRTPFRPHASGTAASERRYWSYERQVKGLETCAGSVVSSTGTLHAIRRELVDEIPDDVTDDFFTSVGVIG